MSKLDFSKLEINLVSHDRGSAPNCLPAYIEVHLGQSVKNKSELVLDLGNYIYRTFGLGYEICPEFRGKGKKTTIRWFMSWRHLEPIRMNILKALCPDRADRMIKVERYLPYEFRSLIIQNLSRGVSAPQKDGAA